MNSKSKQGRQEYLLLTKRAIVAPSGLSPNHFEVHLHLSMGQLLALKNALDSYNTPVSRDVTAFLANAMTAAGIEF